MNNNEKHQEEEYIASSDSEDDVQAPVPISTIQQAPINTTDKKLLKLKRTQLIDRNKVQKIAKLAKKLNFETLNAKQPEPKINPLQPEEESFSDFDDEFVDEKFEGTHTVLDNLDIKEKDEGKIIGQFKVQPLKSTNKSILHKASITDGVKQFKRTSKVLKSRKMMLAQKSREGKKRKEEKKMGNRNLAIFEMNRRNIDGPAVFFCSSGNSY